MEYGVATHKLESRVSLKMRHIALIFLTFGLVLAALPAEAQNRREYAGIVVDAKTGETLYSHDADEKRYPASIAKAMTLYIVFQELEAGNISPSTPLKVSKHAAAAVPTKLYLRPGTTISVENAIKALVTKSANDAARVIAENISGTESEFAERMTRTARALGMHHTVYRNASGLPDSRQITTVRDQARLGSALYQHFPDYADYFKIRAFKYGKGTFGNHNRLLGQYGIDGIKTGYINDAGYNLLTSANKDGRHLIVAAFGFNSGASRNSKVLSLVKEYLPKAHSGHLYAQAKIAKPGPKGHIRVAKVTPAPIPSFRRAPPAPASLNDAPNSIAVASVTGTGGSQPRPAPVELIPANADAATAARTMAGSEDAPTPAPASGDIVGAWISKTLKLDTQQNGDGGPLPPEAIGDAAPQGDAIDLLTSGSVDPSISQSWILQVGASHSEDGAKTLISDAVSKMNGLSDFRPFVETTQKNGRTFYRARFAGFGDGDQARTMCDKLKKQSMSCLAMRS